MIIDESAKFLASLPGFGPRSAQRLLIHLLEHRDQLFSPMVTVLSHLLENATRCSQCGHWDAIDPCEICRDTSRSDAMLCVVANSLDLFAVERTSAFFGKYHVLGGMLSARQSSALVIDSVSKLQRRLVGLTESPAECDPPAIEVVLALGLTLEGQTTSQYVLDQLDGSAVQISRLSFGIPAGGDLDYLDATTIATAFRGRTDASS